MYEERNTNERRNVTFVSTSLYISVPIARHFEHLVIVSITYFSLLFNIAKNSTLSTLTWFVFFCFFDI